MLSTYVYFARLLRLRRSSGCSPRAAPSRTRPSGAGTEKVLANAPFIVQALISIAEHPRRAHDRGRVRPGACTRTSRTRQRRDLLHDADHEVDYLGGRFLGALLFALLVFASLGLGALARASRPSVDGLLRSHGSPPPVAVRHVRLPNAIFTGGFLRARALTRRMMPVYVGAVVLALGYLAAGTLTRTSTTGPSPRCSIRSAARAGAVVRYWTPRRTPGSSRFSGCCSRTASSGSVEARRSWPSRSRASGSPAGHGASGRAAPGKVAAPRAGASPPRGAPSADLPAPPASRAPRA